MTPLPCRWQTAGPQRNNVSRATPLNMHTQTHTHTICCEDIYLWTLYCKNAACSRAFHLKVVVALTLSWHSKERINRIKVINHKAVTILALPHCRKYRAKAEPQNYQEKDSFIYLFWKIAKHLYKRNSAYLQKKAYYYLIYLAELIHFHHIEL